MSRVSVKIPSAYYKQLREMQKVLSEQRMTRVPLWQCFREVELDKERWPDARRKY